MRCPACGLVNPPRAMRCDCRLDLRQQSADTIDKIQFEKAQIHRQRRIVGIAAMLLGITLALPSLVLGYVGLAALFNLPFVFGVIWTVRGQIGLRELAGRIADAQAERALPKATARERDKE